MRPDGFTTIELPVVVNVTVNVKLAWEVRPQASFAVSTNEDVPAAVGVPAIEKPLAAFTNVNPTGSIPELSVNVGTGEKGVTHPPELVIFCW